jgi:hypothetical protein
MVLGDVSLDPRRVVYTSITRGARDWKLAIAYMVGDTVLTLEQYGTKEDMQALANMLDNLAYKGPLADAVSSLQIDGDDDSDPEEKDYTDDNIRDRVGFSPL